MVNFADVNEAFATERAEQISAARRWEEDLQARIEQGTVERLPDGRYRVLTGWDAGEVLSPSGVPQHGLDISQGSAALYSSVPAWHGLGNVIPGGIADVDTVLELAGIAYQVELVPALYQWQGQARTSEGRYHTVREDTGADLGVVGRSYEVIQNRQLFEFLQDLVARYDVIWESAGSMRGGSKVFVSMRLPDTVTVDATGINDEIIPFIVAINTHDGCAASQVVTTPWRPVCGNTERFAVRDAYTRWAIRHTKSAPDRLMEARRTLGLSVRYFEKWAGEETLLARTELAIDDFHKVLADLWPVDDDATDRKKKNASQRRDQITGLFESEAQRTGRTAYAGERAVTEYLDHFASIRPSGVLKDNTLGARGQRLLEGTDDEIKSAAHRRLMALRQR